MSTSTKDSIIELLEDNDIMTFDEEGIEDAFDLFLDEVYVMPDLPFMRGKSVAYLANECDPIWYRCGLSDYESENFVEVYTGVYVSTEQEDEALALIEEE